MLYWKEEANADFCKICQRSRWKQDKQSGENKQSTKGKKITEKLYIFSSQAKTPTVVYVSKNSYFLDMT
jgi:hypothetical protein